MIIEFDIPDKQIQTAKKIASWVLLAAVFSVLFLLNVVPLFVIVNLYWTRYLLIPILTGLMTIWALYTLVENKRVWWILNVANSLFFLIVNMIQIVSGFNVYIVIYELFIGVYMDDITSYNIIRRSTGFALTQFVSTLAISFLISFIYLQISKRNEKLD